MTDGTKLKKVHWQTPHTTLEVGKETVKSLTVSIETGGPWVVVELENSWHMRPLQGHVKVTLANDPRSKGAGDD